MMKRILDAPAAHTLVECLTELKFGRPAKEQMILTELINYTTRRLGNDGPGFDPSTIGEIWEK
jgi:hypothetical protein